MSNETEPAGDEGNDSREETPTGDGIKKPARESQKIWSVVIGFVGAPVILYALMRPDLNRLQSIWEWIFLVVSIPVASVFMLFWFMLFSRRTRFFGLGGILFFGTAFLLLLAICGRGSGF